VQDLQIGFSEIIRRKQLNEVILLGHKNRVESKTRNLTKFGKGLKQFFIEYDLKEGDISIFEVDNVETKPIIDVFVNECYCDIVQLVFLE